MQVDQRLPGALFGYQFVVPADGEWYLLTEPECGLFPLPDPVPAGQLPPDRAVETVLVRNFSGVFENEPEVIVEIGGAENADPVLAGYPRAGFPLQTQETLILAVPKVSCIAVRNPGADPCRICVLLMGENQ